MSENTYQINRNYFPQILSSKYFVRCPEVSNQNGVTFNKCQVESSRMTALYLDGDKLIFIKNRRQPTIGCVDYFVEVFFQTLCWSKRKYVRGSRNCRLPNG